MNLFLLAILTFVAGARSPFPPNGSCARADAESGRLVSAVTRWSADGDSVFNIPPVDSAEIQVETDESVCAKLIEAYSKLPGEVDTPASLYVVKLGKAHFAVFDPNDMSGSSRTVMVFDQGFMLKGSKQHLQP